MDTHARRWVKGLAIAALAALIAFPAAASVVRTASMGGVEAIVEEDSNAINLFNSGNAAGLALLPRENRIDEALLIGLASAETDAFGVTEAVSERFVGLASPGGAYQGLQYWPTDSDVLRISVGAWNASWESSIDSGAAYDSTAAASETVFEAQYARRLGRQMVLGVRGKPRSGKQSSESGAGADSKAALSLLDWNAGLGYEFPLEGEGHVALGLDVMPYDDAYEPRDFLNGLSFAGGWLEPVAYDVKEEKDRLSNSGLTAGAQLELLDGPTSIGLHADLTRAHADLKRSGPAGETNGRQSTYSRYRGRLEGRHVLDMGRGTGLRLAVAVGGAQGRTNELNYPLDRVVVATVEHAPLDAAFGFSFTTPTFTAGMGYSMEAASESWKQEAPGASPVRASISGSAVRMGGEKWLTPEWAGRLGFAMGSVSWDDNDDSTPKPGDPGNPIEYDYAFSLGAGYRADARTVVDASVTVHAYGSDPEPWWYSEHKSRTDLAIGGKFAF